MGKLLRTLTSKWTIGILILVIVIGIVGSRQWSLYYCRQAEAEIVRDRIPEAQRVLGYAVTLWPWNADAHFLTARAARITNDAATAEYHLDRCLKLNGGATERVQLEFLLLRVQSGEIDELSPTLFGLVEREGGHPDTLAILKTLGRAYMQRLRFRPAYACMSKWIEIAPNDPTPYQYRGWSAERLSNTKGAMVDYLKDSSGPKFKRFKKRLKALGAKIERRD